eukprot:7519887-Pyramimonas_sp.AAC.1
MENTSAHDSAGNPAGDAMEVSSSSSISASESKGTSMQCKLHPRPQRKSPQSSLPSLTTLGILR